MFLTSRKKKAKKIKGGGGGEIEYVYLLTGQRR